MENCKNLQYNVSMNREPKFRVDRFREEVKKLGKPAQVAEKIGISYETLYKTTRGDISQPPAETIAKVAILSGKPIDYFMDLLDGIGDVDAGLTDVQGEIAQLIGLLPPYRQRDLLEVARMYVRNNEQDLRAIINLVKDVMIESAHSVGDTELVSVLEKGAEDLAKKVATGAMLLPVENQGDQQEQARYTDDSAKE